MESIDIVALSLITLACLRGIFIGLTREVFSIAAVATSILAVRLLLQPARQLLLETLPFELPGVLSSWLAGGILVILCMISVTVMGRFFHRGIKEAGLGAADRLGGAALGLAEGGLVVALGVAIGLALLGGDHALFKKSQTLAYYKQAQDYIQPRVHGDIDVAAPPPKDKRL
jgi:uncharacterized membrane protein required for colicin V production